MLYREKSSATRLTCCQQFESDRFASYTLIILVWMPVCKGAEDRALQSWSGSLRAETLERYPNMCALLYCLDILCASKHFTSVTSKSSVKKKKKTRSFSYNTLENIKNNNNNILVKTLIKYIFIKNLWHHHWGSSQYVSRFALSLVTSNNRIANTEVWKENRIRSVEMWECRRVMCTCFTLTKCVSSRHNHLSSINFLLSGIFTFSYFCRFPPGVALLKTPENKQLVVTSWSLNKAPGANDLRRYRALNYQLTCLSVRVLTHWLAPFSQSL